MEKKGSARSYLGGVPAPARVPDCVALEREAGGERLRVDDEVCDVRHILPGI